MGLPRRADGGFIRTGSLSDHGGIDCGAGRSAHFFALCLSNIPEIRFIKDQKMISISDLLRKDPHYPAGSRMMPAGN
jgi:hypothetical protein